MQLLPVTFDNMNCNYKHEDELQLVCNTILYHYTMRLIR